MDEVDKIIVYSLKQIDCNIDDNCTIADFTPSLLVHVVSHCLQTIKPLSINIPCSLPEGLPMTQRFSIATKLASIISNLNYRADIGYQTFLYPNEVDVRKLLMFLIEQLPRDGGLQAEGNMTMLRNIEIWRRNIKETIFQQLRRPWIPQYGRRLSQYGRHLGVYDSGHIINSKPHHNLNVCSKNMVSERNSQQHKTISVFQQTSDDKFNLISSILHQNSIDLCTVNETIDPYDQIQVPTTRNLKTLPTSTELVNLALTATTTQSPLSKLTEEMNNLKNKYNGFLRERKRMINNINSLKNRRNFVERGVEQMHSQIKIRERICLLLENPKENISKLETMLQNTQERGRNLHLQWQEYRKPMLMNLECVKVTKQIHNIQNAKELRKTIEELERTLQEKTMYHNSIGTELNSVASSRTAPRKEYICRILEFISNIRKQRSDIFKVLDDTRDMQKQLNSISAQLQRQFSYTDDLLYQTAKSDMHAKQAYKLLATLHTTCNELVELVTKTGNLTNATRELEAQIYREKAKNVTASLQKISADIQKFESVIQNIQKDIYSIENEI